MYINRLQAINIAINAIKQLPSSTENEQAIVRLENMKNDRNIQWTKEMVFAQLNKWKSAHGRNPTVTNLTEPDMPKAVTIQKLFDMRASAFLNIYYPTKKAKRSTSVYTLKTKREWVEGFIKQFNRIQPRSAKDYNAKRDKDTPTWLTIARYLNVATWNELLILTKVNTRCLHKTLEGNVKDYKVNSTSALYEKMENLLVKK